MSMEKREAYGDGVVVSAVISLEEADGEDLGIEGLERDIRRSTP